MESELQRLLWAVTGPFYFNPFYLLACRKERSDSDTAPAGRDVTTT
jgi:hypothetical protein